MRIEDRINEVRPNLSTIIRYKDRLYFATARGIGIAFISDKEFRLLLYEDNKKWGMMHFSIFYNDRIVFIPHRTNALYILDPENEKIEKRCFTNRVKEEVLVPYLYNGDLMMLGTESEIVYSMNKNYNIRKEDKELRMETKWRCRSGFSNEDNICMWDSSRISLIHKRSNKCYIMDDLKLHIYEASIYDGTVYILSQEGIFGFKIGNNKIFRLPINDLSEMSGGVLFKNNCLYILPERGNRIRVIRMTDGCSYEKKVSSLPSDREFVWMPMGAEKAICLSKKEDHANVSKFEVLVYDVSKENVQFLEFQKKAWIFFVQNLRGYQILMENEEHGVGDFMDSLIDLRDSVL